MDKKDKSGYPLTALIVAIVVVAALSLVPWSKLTGNFLKDYDLLSDLFPKGGDDEAEANAAEYLDPSLLAELQKTDTISMPVAPMAIQSDSAAAQNVGVESKQARQAGKMVIEDYTPMQDGMLALKAALADASGSKVRIAVIGDSYIEGDIFTQDIRSNLQQQYGGKGVGYMAAHSQVSGFRRSVIHSDQGWTQHAIQQAASSKYFNLAGEYFVGDKGATITYKGTSKDPKLSNWDQTRLLFIAPNSGTIKLTANNDTVTYDVEGGDQVQQIVLESTTSRVKITNNVAGLVLLGVWLEGNNGVGVDCMSIRGDSGILHRKINIDLSSQMRQYVDYDLIVVEYGINALSAAQKNYDQYGKLMVQVLQRLKECYPDAAILMLGIGDRGQKINGEVHSLPTAPAMVDAQRNAAKQAGVLFWDMREAMGGEDAIVQWRNDKLVNADYIHLNSQGGKVMANLLVESILDAVR